MDIQAIYNIYEQHSHVYIDSRIDGKNGIFVALKGENFDGNNFAAAALKTAKYAIVDNPAVAVDNRYIVVDNALKTLQQLATHHRNQLDIPVIGITGTNGKTTTKELINTVLSKQYKTYATKGNLNNHIGVPLSILEITKEHEIAVIEMGASRVGDIELLCEIAHPNYGIITNIGRAHLETFGKFENILSEKNKLYQYFKEHKGIIFINNEDTLLADICPPCKTISYGTSSFTHLQGFFCPDSVFVHFYWQSGRDIEKNVDINWIKENRLVKTSLIGSYNFDNLLAASCVGDYFKVRAMDIKQAIEEYVPQNNRSQYKKTATNELIIDCYNANPYSMQTAINSFAEIPKPNKVMILGDMLELGDLASTEHSIIVKLASNLKFEQVHLIGEVFYSFKNKAVNFKYYKDIVEFMEYMKTNPIKESYILIKGSNRMKMERIVPCL